MPVPQPVHIVLPLHEYKAQNAEEEVEEAVDEDEGLDDNQEARSKGLDAQLGAATVQHLRMRMRVRVRV